MRRLVLALLTSVALVACGGSGSDTVTREEFIAAADAFCKKTNEEAKKRNEELQKIATEAKSEDEFWDKVVPELEEGLAWTEDKQAEFKKIEPPEEDRATIDKFVATTQEEIDLLDRVVNAARKRDLERFGQLATEQEKIDNRGNEIARDYGMKECGSDASEAEAS